jgi:hypothetical protein
MSPQEVTKAELATLVEVAREAQDWLRGSPYKSKQGDGDRDMADRLYEALQPFSPVRSAQS